MWEVCGSGLAEVLLMAEKIFLSILLNIEVLSPIYIYISILLSTLGSAGGKIELLLIRM